MYKSPAHICSMCMHVSFMCAGTYVCMNTCVHVCLHASGHNIYSYTYIQLHIHIQIQIHKYVHTHLHKHTCIHMCVYIYICVMCICICVCIYIYTRMCIYGYPPIWGPLGFFTPRRKPLNHHTMKPTERATMGPAFETRHVSRFRRDLSYIILLSCACINSSWLFTVLLVLVCIYVAYQSCCCL